MQLEEVMVGVAAERAALVEDYLAEGADESIFASAIEQLAVLPQQDLLDFGKLAELLGYDRKVKTLDHTVTPRGHRVLGRVPRLPKLAISELISEFGGLDDLIAASDEDLAAVEGVGEFRARDIRESMRRQQEINLVDRYLQT